MSKVLKQGESYDATANGENPEEEYNKPEDDLRSKKQVDIKIIAIAGVAIVVVLVLLAIVLMKNLKPAEDVEVANDGVIVDEDNPASALLNSDAAFSGEPQEPVVEEDTQTTVDDTANAEAFELRKRGYTADEIEFYRNQGLHYDDMIAMADEEIENYQREVLASLSDEGSEAYQTLLNMTWLQGADLAISDLTYDEFGNTNTYDETKTMNIDYEKVPAKGTQLMLKCYCQDFGVAFMSTTPDRWLQLADKGNILVSVTVRYWNGVPIIIDIVELDAGDREDYLESLGVPDGTTNEVQP